MTTFENMMERMPEASLNDDFDALPSGRLTHESSCGNVRTVLDRDEFEFYMEASPDAESEVIADCIDRLLSRFCLELIPEDECEPDVTDEGWTRIYAVPVRPVDDAPLLREAGSTRARFMAFVGSAICSAPATPLILAAVLG